MPKQIAMRIKKLHKLILSSFVGPFVITFLVALFILIMQFLWKYVDDLMGKGLDYTVIAELLFYASANLVPMALPLAILLSSIMTFGALAENSELTALKSSGMSLFKIMFPLIVIVFGFSSIALFFSNNVWPAANLKMTALIFDIQQQKPALNIKENSIYRGIEGYAIRVDEKNDETSEMVGVRVNDHTEKYAKRTIKSKGGLMTQSDDKRYLFLTLDDGVIYEEMNTKVATANNSFPMQKTYFEEARFKFDLSAFQLQRTDEQLWSEDYEMLNLSQLNLMLDSMNGKRNFKITEYEAFLANNFTLLHTPPTASLTTYETRNSFYETLDYITKQQVLSNTINQVKSTKTFISNRINDMNIIKEKEYRYGVEWHRKFTLSFGCLVMFFIGAPLGAIIKRGGLGLPVVFSVIFFVIYYILSISGEKMATAVAVKPVWGMWLSAFVLFPIGVFLTYKAATDSALFDREAYKKLAKRIMKK